MLSTPSAEHVMAMPSVSHPITTVEALLALPDDGLRHELLDGEHVVTPAPALVHQRAVGLLFVPLTHYLSDRRDVELFTSPADVVLGPKILVQPDLFVARRPPDGLRTWADVGVPVLAIEILSPGTAARDRGTKRAIYQREGVTEYWIVDLDARLVERWRPDDERPEILRERLEWRATERGEAFAFELTEFFAAVWEDVRE